MKEYKVFLSKKDTDEYDALSCLINKIVNEKNEISISTLFNLVQLEYPKEILDEYAFKQFASTHFFTKKDIIYS